MMHPLPQTPYSYLLCGGKKLLGPHPRIRSGPPHLSRPRHTLSCSPVPKATSEQTLTGPLAPTEHPTPCCTLYRTPNTRHTPGAAAPDLTAPALLPTPRSWKLPRTFRQASCHHLCLPSPMPVMPLRTLLPLFPARPPHPPAGRVATWGPRAPEGYSVVSGLTMGTSWPTSEHLCLSCPESREWEVVGAQGLHLDPIDL